MLDTDTKRRIDTARDILVGKVPDPKSQVEQITIALIYKFMDDMDAESEELGGKRKFFANQFARYGWANLMHAGLGGFEILNLYAEAIAKMPENPGIPPLFRDIFKNAYLPYRDPETLKMFLKVIDEFSYDHSERLGDAFEYLLSVLGSQGDAGQFRTPRHIIDFMVEVIDPKKTETVLDPACGTAGFLISSYKHILKANTDAKGHSTLTPDEKGRLAQNFRGYDISPDMVRLSLVNMYLHGFVDPHIYEYDTLASQDKWNEYADVILANPPFMSPKGGIKPHNRFSIQAKRSEVLFVDYMAEHLNPTGRAGIIVPEGIIFQSQTAYKQLRKMLVDDYLVAVVSLPAGVFNPYSGVKTSVLILDKPLAKKTSTIAFFKVENDGFGLGAQRRAIGKNDLPQTRAEIGEYLGRLRAGEPIEDLQPTLGLIVQKEKIAANGDYNLTGDRYGAVIAVSTQWPMVELGEFALLINGRAYKQEELLREGATPVLRVGNFFSNRDWYYSDLELEEDKYCNAGDLLYAWSASFGPRIWEGPRAIYHYHIWKIETTDAIDKRFLFYLLQADSEKIKSEGHGIAMMHATKGDMEKRKFPLPPLDVQREIVAKLDGYQRIIDGAKQVVANWRPTFDIDPDWPLVELREIIDELESGVSVNSTSKTTDKGEFGILKTSCVTTGIFQPEEHKTVVPEELTKMRCPVRGNTIIISRMNTEALVGANAYVAKDYPHLFLPDRLWQTVITRSDIEVRYIQTVLASDSCRRHISTVCGGTSGSMKNISKPQLLSIAVPLPPLATQQAIVAEIEAEQALVAANRELIARFEKKIQATLARVWGSSSNPEVD